MKSTRLNRLAIGIILGQSRLTNAFWRMNCAVIQTGRVDPIADPGNFAAHAHTIVGGSNIGINSTYENLTTSGCNSCEVYPDMSAYWTPILYYQRPNGSFQEVGHSGSVVYYLGRGQLQDGSSEYTPFPEGFKMISGNKALRAFNESALTWGNASYPSTPIQNAATFLCIGLTNVPPATVYLDANGSCTAGLRAQIHFQTCWDGVNLYLSDNSHVAHLSAIDDGVCPPGYPKLLPHLFLETDWGVTDLENITDGGQFVWSQGDPTGYGYHADFLNGWNMTIQEEAVANCLLPGGDGTINECPILLANDNTQFAANCPEQPAEIIEPVKGLIGQLPGCNLVYAGPSPAGAAQVSCTPGTPASSIVTTIDSTPAPTADPAIGSQFGNANNIYLGCGNDTYGSLGESVSGLRLLNAVTNYDYENMTVEYCQSYCTSQGYRLSGIEYGTECFCDNAYYPGSTFYAGINMSTGCSMTCPGYRYELCGGPSYMSVFNNTDPNFIETNSTAGSVVQLDAVIDAFPSNYVGCYSDVSDARTLNSTGFTSSAMTNELCAAYCAASNYAFYGTEYASQCYCGFGYSSGTFLDNSTNPELSGCSYRCAGNFSELCGGSGTISVYQSTNYTPILIPTLDGLYISKGCLTDPDTNGRALTGALYEPADVMTVPYCINLCKEGGFRYAGIEYASQCFCGDSINSAAGAVAQTCIPADLMPCDADSYMYCGAGNLLQLYYSATAGK